MKTLFVLIAGLLFGIPVFCQTHCSTFNPFDFEHHSLLLMTKDMNNEVWFLTLDTLGDSIYIINQSKTHYYSLENENFDTYQPGFASFMVDSRGDFLWLDNQNRLNRFNGVAKQIILDETVDTLGIWNETHLLIADDHVGNDYILSERKHYDSFHMTSVLDSLLLTKFDGHNVTSYNITQFGFSSPNFIFKRLFCDYSGNVYIEYDGVQLIKFDGNTFTSIPFQVIGHYDFTFDLNDNLYINDGSQHIYRVMPNWQLQTIYTHGAGNLLTSNLIVDNNGTLWLIIGNKVLKYSNSQFTTIIPNMAYQSGLYCSYLGNNNSLFDESGNILALTYNCEVFAYSFNGFNTIGGHVFMDSNQNATLDNGEIGLCGFVVNQTPDNFVASTDSVGRYNDVFFDSTQTHSIFFSAPPYFHLTTPSSYLVLPEDSPLCCYDFGIAPNSLIQDMKLEVTPSFARPGFTSGHWIAVNNVGTTTCNDTITYIYDPLLNYVSSSPIANEVSGDTLKWYYSSLKPFERQTIVAYFYLDSTVSIGTQLSCKGTVTPLSIDTTPNNNTVTKQYMVTGSFDPNIKTVQPPAGINAGDTLWYTVYFQNTGNVSAINIILRDTLDGNLDWSTFKVLDFSHSMDYNLKTSGIITFSFNNIMLADSNHNEALSHGFVKYMVQVKNGLANGISINNRASIYFDFNQPIPTNVTSNVIGGPASSIAKITLADIYIYPNPANTQCTVVRGEASETWQLSITDLNGRQILNKTVSGTRINVSLQELPPGIYILSAVERNNYLGHVKLTVVK